MNVNVIKAKDILTKSKLPDADFVINPYVGCNHGCIYCYAEYMSRFTGHKEKWGDFIDIKDCEKPINMRRIIGHTVLLGSSTDPYNPLEKKWEVTRNALKQLTVADTRVEILTKSPLVLRDVDILRQLKDVHVGVSISTVDDGFARIIERYAPSPTSRVDAMRSLQAAGIPVYAFISPIFPLVSDYTEVVRAVEPYVEMICFENLNLRGAYKRTVLNVIRGCRPDKYEEFSNIYSSRENFVGFWLGVEREIREFMIGKNYRVYFFHGKVEKNRGESQ
jgi:DNA repair photolyase